VPLLALDEVNLDTEASIRALGSSIGPQISHLARVLSQDPIVKNAFAGGLVNLDVIRAVVASLQTSHMASFNAILARIQTFLWENLPAITQDLTAQVQDLQEKPDHFMLTREIEAYSVKFEAYFHWDDASNRVTDVIYFDVLSYEQ